MSLDSPRDSAIEYAQRMNRVLDHVDRHLDTPLDLPTLAEVAHFSAFHFHRVFAAWMGETLGDYLRRRRLDVGASLLIRRPRAPVLEVALAVGFGSGEAFARAFKLQFGSTPSAWRIATPRRWAEELEAQRQRRAQSNLDQALRNLDQAPGGGLPNHRGSSNPEPVMALKTDVKTATLPAVRVAYMRYIGPYGAGVGKFWGDTFYPWLIANGLEHAARYGIGHDDPGITAPDKCRYDACVEVPADFMPKGQVGVTVLPGGRYAMAEFEGTGPEANDAWNQMLRGWLPASGMQLDARPCFEYYPVDARYDPQTGAFQCQLCLPVCPL